MILQKWKFHTVKLFFDTGFIYVAIFILIRYYIFLAHPEVKYGLSIKRYLYFRSFLIHWSKNFPSVRNYDTITLIYIQRIIYMLQKNARTKCCTYLKISDFDVNLVDQWNTISMIFMTALQWVRLQLFSQLVRF